jgi:hypothetical protein
VKIHPSRRDFLLEVARTAAYVPPTLVTLGAPGSLAAQGPPTGKSMGKGKWNRAEEAPDVGGSIRTAPWEADPPGGP